VENMGKVVLDMAMSLDGFVAGANDADGGLHNWYFNPASKDKEVIESLIANTGALVMGKRAYNMGDQYDGYVDNPYKVVHFIITHHVPDKPALGDTEFVFVRDGITSAIQQAKNVAGDKDVIVGGGADIAQQLLKANLIDTIQLHLIPVLLGDGIRLFDNLDSQSTQLELTDVVEGTGVTHLTYRILKS